MTRGLVLLWVVTTTVPTDGVRQQVGDTSKVDVAKSTASKDWKCSYTLDSDTYKLISAPAGQEYDLKCEGETGGTKKIRALGQGSHGAAFRATVGDSEETVVIKLLLNENEVTKATQACKEVQELHVKFHGGNGSDYISRCIGTGGEGVDFFTVLEDSGDNAYKGFHDATAEQRLLLVKQGLLGLKDMNEAKTDGKCTPMIHTDFKMENVVVKNMSGMLRLYIIDLDELKQGMPDVFENDVSPEVRIRNVGPELALSVKAAGFKPLAKSPNMANGAIRSWIASHCKAQCSLPQQGEPNACCAKDDNPAWQKADRYHTFECGEPGKGASGVSGTCPDAATCPYASALDIYGMGQIFLGGVCGLDEFGWAFIVKTNSGGKDEQQPHNQRQLGWGFWAVAVKLAELKLDSLEDKRILWNYPVEDGHMQLSKTFIPQRSKAERKNPSQALLRWLLDNQEIAEKIVEESAPNMAEAFKEKLGECKKMATELAEGLSAMCATDPGERPTPQDLVALLSRRAPRARS